jgi:hypothetical protein
MTHATPERIADDEREPQEAGAEDDFRAAPGVDASRPTAEQFHITDMQHWIDLSA